MKREASQKGSLELVPPLRIVVDESGEPTCREAPGDAANGGLLACAAAIPETIAESLVGLLPRDSSGRMLKSSTREMSPQLLQTFLEQLPMDRMTVAIVAIATNSATNEMITIQQEEIANHWRKFHHHRKIARSSILRLKIDTEAILNVWAAHSSRQLIAAKDRRVAEERAATGREDWRVLPGDRDKFVTFMSVTIDEGNHTDATRRDAPTWFHEAMRRKGVIAQPFRWASEEEEPLLAIPDLIAGALRRHGERRDLPNAMRWIREARAVRQVWTQDGMTSFLPEPPPAAPPTA